MPNAKLINRSELPNEPEYNTPDEALTPVNACTLNNEEEKEPTQKIVKAYFTNLEDEPLEKITKEKEIYLVVETENMSGEEVIINLPNHYGDFKYEDEEITEDKVLKISISSNSEKIKLETIARKKAKPKTLFAEESEETPSSLPVTSTDEDANIVSVEFLNGGDDKILTSKGDQYVNLPYEDKWVDGKIIKNKDRLSNKPRVLVKFDKAGSHSFKIKLILGGSNAVYTAKEKGRNANFKYEENEKTYTTSGDGTIIIDDLFLTVAGNDNYTLSATDAKGKTVKSSGSISTKRFFYYVELKMKGLKSVATSLTTFETEFVRNYMKLEGLAAVEMKHMQNISTGDSNTFKSLARKSYDISTAGTKEPYCVAIGYTDHLAVKNNGTLEKTKIEFGIGKPKVDISIKGKGLKVNKVQKRALWRGIVKSEDWFINCKYKLDGKAKWEDIPEEKCTAKQRVGYPKGYCDVVEIDVKELPKGKGAIRLEVNWVDRMRGGLSFGGGNLVCICTRAWWQAKTTLSQNQTLIHEVGHKVGMVSDGSGNLPKKVATHYAAKGHVGNHCYNGNAKGESNYNTKEARKKSTCVMFGTVNGKTKFCEKCHPTVRKLDISKGWSKF